MQHDSSVPELTAWQKRDMSLITGLLRAAVVCFVCDLFLTVFCWMSCPTATSGESGHIYPLFDKIHSHVVYLTEIEHYVSLTLTCLGVACLFAAILIDFDLKRSVARPEDCHIPD
jgi:hypothetical protein